MKKNFKIEEFSGMNECTRRVDDYLVLMNSGAF